MGKLLCLELYNFKSYKGHHVLQFGDSYFTSIIGPNGSGKSNSMDAISFVLGIKSSHLRSAHLKDLVYRGRVLKHSKINADGTATDGVNGDANGDADGDEATPAASQRNDPQTAWVMAVYEDDAGEEQRWKRSITSAGQSEYRINNKIVTAKQYNEALEEENILIKARNFLVFQGDVEAIASQNARDLTRLIEQISGSLDYKSEYERLKVEKERADETQADKLNSRRGINGEIKAYREQKDELDRYESKRDEKDAAIVTHVLWKLFHFQRTIEESTAEMQKHNAELAEYRRGVQKYEDNLEEAKRQQAKVSREINKFEGDIKRKERAVEEKRHELVPVEEKLSVSKANVEKRQKHIDTIAAERDKNQASADNFRKQLATVQKAQKRWEDEWRVQQQQTGRELSEEDLAEYQSLRDEITKQAGNEQTKIDQTSRQLKTDEETVKSLKSTLETTQTEVTDLESTLAQLNEQRIETNSIIKATTKEINAKKNTINGLTSEKERTTQKRRELEEKHVAVLHKLRDAKAIQRESRKEAEQKEMVAELKRIYPGVRGMVHQLCKPKQKKYETAIVTALGRHWDAIITDTEKTAKDCISYIRDKKFGRMSFIPLDNIVHTQPNSNLRGIHQGTRLAIDAIDFDSSLERAMGFVCGSTLVTDTVNIARHLCYERNVEAKAVALDGTIIHRGGNMTGGAEPGGKKRRFEEAEVEKLQELESKFRAEIDALPKWSTKRHEELEQLRSELSGLEMNLKYAQDQLQTFEHNIQSTTKKFKHAEKQLAESQRKYDEHAAGVATLREQLEEQSGAVEELKDSTFAAFCQRLGYANIREYEKQQGALQQEAETKKREFTAQISRLEGQVSRETSRLEEIKKRIALIEQASKRDHNQITLSEREKAEIEAALEEMEGEIEELEGQLAERKEEHDKRKEKVNEARRELSKRSADVDATSKQITTLQGEVQKASNGRYATLKSCKLENIELPLAEGSRKLASLPLEDAVLEEEEDEDAMDVDGETRQARVNDFGIEVDFEELEDDLQEDDSDTMDSQLSEKIANLQAELEKMQPNMRSAERLQSTNERLQGVEKEFEESRSAAKRATKEFEKVKNKRMDLFNKAFKHISDQIQPVYAELTKTASFPLGGQASLDVEDDNEPYLSGVKYHAMPPLKRFRDMEHLSGGEKTMAALALLFAIHTYAPSPFFVLDEVDAALDNANTSQLAQYVRDHAGPGMQFVVISLKTGLFQNSETLVGIMRDQAVNSSRALTLDLRKYQAV